LRKPKLSNNEVVAPGEEEEEDEGILKPSILCIFKIILLSLLHQPNAQY
jgi:hypothetical protein